MFIRNLFGKSLKLSVVAAAFVVATVILGTSPAGALAGGNTCDPNELCVYEHQDFKGKFKFWHENVGKVDNLEESAWYSGTGNPGDDISSFWNRTARYIRLHEHERGWTVGGKVLCIAPFAFVKDLHKLRIDASNSGDSRNCGDKISSWRIYTLPPNDYPWSDCNQIVGNCGGCGCGM